MHDSEYEIEQSTDYSLQLRCACINVTNDELTIHLYAALFAACYVLFTCLTCIVCDNEYKIT